ELKYCGYLARERSAAERLARMSDVLIPPGINYHGILSLSFEAREKLTSIQPRSLGHASKIPGVSPSDLHSLLGEILRQRRMRDPSASTETRHITVKSPGRL